jgi:hypothetical protein
VFFSASSFGSTVLADLAEEKRACVCGCFSWRWASVGRAIDPQERLCFFEFAQLFLEALPIRNCIENSLENFVSAQVELFWRIFLEVKGFATIQESIASFFQAEVISYTVGQTIDILWFVLMEDMCMIFIIWMK